MAFSAAYKVVNCNLLTWNEVVLFQDPLVVVHNRRHLTGCWMPILFTIKASSTLEHKEEVIKMKKEHKEKLEAEKEKSQALHNILEEQLMKFNEMEKELLLMHAKIQKKKEQFLGKMSRLCSNK